MWHKEYKDYKKDECLIKQQTEPSKGIIGCEMHDYNGWGEEYHYVKPKKQKIGLLKTLINSFFKRFSRK